MKEIRVWYVSTGMFTGWCWSVVFVDKVTREETLLADAGEYLTPEKTFEVALRAFHNS